jgi:cobalamin synthase
MLLSAGILLLASIFFDNQAFFQDPEIRNLTLVIFPILAFTGLIASLMVYRIRINQVNRKATLGKKLYQYRSALIVRWAILESACYITILAYMFSGLRLLLAIVAFLMVYLIMLKPNLEKTIIDLDLDHKERALLMDPDTKIDLPWGDTDN